MYNNGVPFLKEPYDEDTAVLGQFCAKVITCEAFTNTQNVPWSIFAISCHRRQETV